MKDRAVHLEAGVRSAIQPAWVSQTASSLLRRAQGNEAEGWRRLVALYGPWVYGIARRQGLGPEDAADVTQETFQTLHQHLSHFQHHGPRSSFRGWLKRIVRNKVCDLWRRRAGQAAGVGGSSAYALLQQLADPSRGDEALSQDEAASVAEDEAQWLHRRALVLVRTEFAEPTWQAFWRTAVEERDPREVADELGMSRNAVYIAKSRVLCRLREELADLAPE